MYGDRGLRQLYASLPTLYIRTGVVVNGAAGNAPRRDVCHRDAVDHAACSRLYSDAFRFFVRELELIFHYYFMHKPNIFVFETQRNLHNIYRLRLRF